MAPLGRFEAQLPLFGLLPSAVDFLTRPILDGSNVRRGTFSLTVCQATTMEVLSNVPPDSTIPSGQAEGIGSATFAGRAGPMVAPRLADAEVLI